MKKILFIAASVLMLSGCSLDINHDPNHPDNEDVTADLIFPSISNAIAATTGDVMFNYGGFFSQYFEQSPSSMQYTNISIYRFNSNDDILGSGYRALYAGALMDIKEVNSKTTNVADLFATSVLKTYAYQLLVDNLDKCPYTETLQGLDNLTPKWDDGETVYKGVLGEMDEAQAKLTDGDVIDLTDPLFDQNLSQWVGFANALRLRMYLRFIDGGIDVDSYTAKAVALVQKNQFFTGDVAFALYEDVEGRFNPWYDEYFDLGAQNHCAASPIISYMTATDDPRIAYSFNKAAGSGEYSGQYPGSTLLMKGWGTNTTWTNSDVSIANYANMKTSPVYFFTQSELQFLIAEVQLRFLNNPDAAKAAYTAGVAADFVSKGYAGQEATFLSGDMVNWDKMTTTADQLNLIYMQKWASLLFRDHMEAWSEIRRTDTPTLSAFTGQQIYEKTDADVTYTPGQLILPAMSNMTKDVLVKRIMYPQTPEQLNSNTPENTPDTPATPVFWDKK